MKTPNFDVIVVGAGHAGIEACLATSRLGLETLVVTTNTDRIGYMSCNPSIGGLAKGHMVREIDILGGEMGRVADETCIQFKRLNSTKGPAVRGSRAQCDKEEYNKKMRSLLETTENLQVQKGEVKRLLLEGSVCRGVVLDDGSEIHSKTVVITAGTFMNGVMHIGLSREAGGRVGDQASVGLSDQLREFGFDVRRLKTGTPPRLRKQSIDWTKTSPQFGDEKFYPFSTRSVDGLRLPQVACYLSRTTELTHEIIRKNLDKSPMFCGAIEGSGPRYCPSIEDKVTRFIDKDSHQTFLEPESLSTDLIYLQGISTSLPIEVQHEFLRTIPGLENVEVVRPGYAVEYDFIEPTQIWHRLETRPIANLFLAGQINGTSGYEEAAAQGLIAGINAAHKILGREEFVLGRDQAYIGVLIDDLVTKGTIEPYRMFTSRAEHRLVLREDNTVDRLGEVSAKVGLSSSSALDQIQKIKSGRESYLGALKNTFVYPKPETQATLQEIGTTVLGKSISFEELLRRPEIDSSKLERLGFVVETSDPRVTEAVEIEVKYSGYVKRQMEIIHQAKRMEEMLLPEGLAYGDIKGLRKEEIEKLSRIRPRTLGQAQRISGVNPSAIQAILIYLKVIGKNFHGANLVQHENDDRSIKKSLADSRVVPRY